jgi:hypothetical protein
VFCHHLPGIDGGGNVPISATRRTADLDQFVFGGLLVQGWHAHFTDKLTANDLEKIKAFIQGTADAILAKVAGPGPGQVGRALLGVGGYQRSGPDRPVVAELAKERRSKAATAGCWAVETHVPRGRDAGGCRAGALGRKASAGTRR